MPDYFYVISFQDGVLPSAAYTGAGDTLLNSDSPAANYGSFNILSVGKFGSTQIFRMTLKFDISSLIPAGAEITRAVLTLYYDTAAPLDNTINAYAAAISWD